MDIQCIIPCTIHAMLILTVHPILLSHIGWDGHSVYDAELYVISKIEFNFNVDQPHFSDCH